ncbi:MAG: phosphoribosylanthranilate isomerase, partial [Elusimicrobia bacterium]|nr:phosphoribosylanthranilate isomerase [Elusimicrobiota bacterium]
MTVIKICGITSVKDLDLCLEAGADLVGFNIYPKSKRYIDRKTLADFLSVDSVKEKAVIVGVNETVDFWQGIISRYNPGYIQLHGDEGLDIVKSIKSVHPSVNIIKKVNINKKEVFKDILKYADYLLCDTRSADYGGTGKKFNWEKLKNIDKKIKEKLFVAGGITRKNIENLLKYNIYGAD